MTSAKLKNPCLATTICWSHSPERWSDLQRNAGRHYVSFFGRIHRNTHLLAGNYEERAPVAAARFLAGNTKKIILANDGVRRGWSREHQRNLYSIERSEGVLVKCGVPREAIVRLPFLKSGTVYDALAVKDYLSRHNIRRVLLVTSDYHTRRSLWIFKRVFQQIPVTIGIEPSTSSAGLFSEVALEYIKYGYYLLRFGVLGDTGYEKI